MRVRFAPLFLAASQFLAAPIAQADDVALYAGVANVVKAAGAKSSALDALTWAYRSLRLLDEKGAFRVAALDGKGLLAPVEVDAFVDHIVACASKNQYLNGVMRAFAKSGYAFQGADRDAVIAKVIGYAVALARLTKLMRDDWRVVAAVQAHWAQYKKGMRHLKVLNLFEKAKFLTVEYMITQLLRNHREHKIPADSGRATLPLNIMEAVLEDTRLRNLDNARVGITLALAKPGEEKLNKRTGAGPTTFSDDGKAIAYRMPLSKRWDDLYTVWNLAFVSHYGRFPYLFAKLLTPQVLCYEEDPHGYIYNRGLALYMHLHQATFERMDRAAAKANGKPFPEELAWADPALTKLFSATNVASSRDYDQALQQAEPSLARALRIGLTSAMGKLSKLGEGALDKLRTATLAPFAKATELGTKVKKGVGKALDSMKEGAKKAASKLKALFGR